MLGGTTLSWMSRLEKSVASFMIEIEYTIVLKTNKEI